ncbi:dentin sialophosphoprotein-like isoform X2 [Cynara cardunculus var. scolymus]|uniref:dentin sialophosphoprotein-like isoform X2 n=1 Tax=Cynara cardunculus var. scolymus TaxID=59895 RepID=UPI000D6236B0|nr:dentin sialophosphoprotein-like isoform X2 [Cynara cardunculus var. scolymus]
MDKHGFVVVLLFLFMIGSGRSNALNSRKLVTTPDPNGSSNANQDTPLSSPPPDEKKQNPSPVTKPKDAPTTNSSDDESKGMNDANTKASSENSSDKTQDKGKSHDGKEKVENQTQLKTFASKYCKGNPFCSDQEKTMIACIQDIENGTNKLTLLVRNERDKPLKVNVTLGTSVNKYLPAFDIPGHGTEKVNITFSGDKSTKVILNAGNGDCELRIDGPKTLAVDDASKIENGDNTSKPKDVENPADSPVKPKDKDSPAKLKDVDLAKSKEAEDIGKPKTVDSPAKDKDADDAAKTKDADDAAKTKAKDDDDAAKGKAKDDDNEANGKAKNKNDAAKSKDADDATKAKDNDNGATAKDVDDAGKAKDVDDAGKAKDVDDAAKVKDVDDAAKVKDEEDAAKLKALVIGGSWAMCSFRKRRTNGGVPYQELEMGLPESSNAIDVETAEGWDQDWDDDDWDEDKAIRSPGARMISSNGLMSRATKKDGWDADWEN